MSRIAPPDHAVTIAVKVGLHHCDPLGVAWHGRYFEWLEMARTELFASRDLDVPVIAAMGFRMYVVDAQCRYMAPLAYGQTAVIAAWFTANAPLIRVAYDVRDAVEDRWCARATTVLATTDAQGGLLATTPVPIVARLPEVRQPAD